MKRDWPFRSTSDIRRNVHRLSLIMSGSLSRSESSGQNAHLEKNREKKKIKLARRRSDDILGLDQTCKKLIHALIPHLYM